MYTHIRHLVISGGFVHGISIYGAMRELATSGHLLPANLESIYATSCGGIVGIVAALRYDWTWMDEYLLDRPWGDVFRMNIDTVFGMSPNRGMFSRDAFVTLLSPVLMGKGFEADVSLAAFRAATGVDIHFFATEVDPFEMVDISAATHPDWMLIDAVYASCCVPGFFAPLVKDGRVYIDGVFINNCPFKECLASVAAATEADDAANAEDTILVIKMADDVFNPAATTASLMEFMHLVAVKQIARSRAPQPESKHCLTIPRAHVGEFDIPNFVKHRTCRTDLIAAGVAAARAAVAAAPPSTRTQPSSSPQTSPAPPT
jgi:predicted acylesterase/phospholipase RssA